MKPYEKPELDAILVDGTDIVCESNMQGGGGIDEDGGGNTDNGGGDIEFGSLNPASTLN